MISSWLLWGSIESYGSRGGEWERQDTLRGGNALNQQILVLFFRNWSTVISIMVWTYRVGITIWIHPVLLHHLVSRPHSTHRQVGCRVHSRYYILYPLCWIYSTLHPWTSPHRSNISIVRLVVASILDTILYYTSLLNILHPWTSPHRSNKTNVRLVVASILDTIYSLLNTRPMNTTSSINMS